LALCRTKASLRPQEAAHPGRVAESPFEELQETRLPNSQTLDRDGLVAFFASLGWIADLPDVDRLPLLDEVRSLLSAGEYRRLWETHVYWTRLVAAV
jgi:hypothetical protein